MPLPSLAQTNLTQLRNEELYNTIRGVLDTLHYRLLHGKHGQSVRKVVVHHIHMDSCFSGWLMVER